MKKNKKIIDVIHEKDLEEFLNNLELYNNFKSGLINCKYCNKPVHLDNICAIHIKKGQIEFICSIDPCYEKFLMHQKGDVNV